MSKTYIFDNVERALNHVPREQWASSQEVSKALLGCPRLRGIIRNLMVKRSVSLECFEDIHSEVALISQMKMLEKLDAVSSVYFVLYRVAQLVIYNWGKKEENTFFSPEVSMNECKAGDEDDQAVLDRLNLVQGFTNDGKEAERQLDQRLARERLARKIETLGWPSDVTRERKKIGRPSKKAEEPA